MQQNRYFYSLNDFLRERHGEKVMKLSLDGGFTCPNRDGTLSRKGCIFCSSRGSGDFIPSRNHSLTTQLQENVDLLSRKWPNTQKYIAYFQSYTNTYGSLDTLKEQFEQALSFPGVVGLAIATRPDCLSDDILDYLSDLNKRTHLWIELGLQTIHEHTSEWINRGHSLQCFDEAVYKLHHLGIEVVTHIILGLPGETFNDMKATAYHLAHLPLQGVKIHMLHIIDNAPLFHSYKQNPFPLLSEDEYVAIVGEILRILPAHFVIHRLTGDGDKKHLVAPLWTAHKTKVLNHITKHLRQHQIFQGHL